MTPHSVIAALEKHAGYWRGKTKVRREFAQELEAAPGNEHIAQWLIVAEYERKAKEAEKWAR